MADLPDRDGDTETGRQTRAAAAMSAVAAAAAAASASVGFSLSQLSLFNDAQKWQLPVAISRQWFQFDPAKSAKLANKQTIFNRAQKAAELPCGTLIAQYNAIMHCKSIVFMLIN